MELKDMSLNDICEDLIEAGRHYAQYNPEDFHVWCEIMGTRKVELLRRFGELEERRDFWIEKATLLQTENNELQKQVEDMKCCTNCEHYGDSFECIRSIHNIPDEACCEHWQSDQMSRAEMMKG